MIEEVHSMLDDAVIKKVKEYDRISSLTHEKEFSDLTQKELQNIVKNHKAISGRLSKTLQAFGPALLETKMKELAGIKMTEKEERERLILGEIVTFTSFLTSGCVQKPDSPISDLK